MDTEILDVVDAQDYVINQRPRNEIHALSLMHRAVHILLFNDKKQLLLQKRSLKKDQNKGLWDSSAAGHVDPGESYAACADRELQEELGISTELTPVFKLSASPETGMEFVQVFFGQHTGPFVPAVDEIDEVQWLTIDEVNQQVACDEPTLTGSFKLIWRQYLTTCPN